VRGDWEELERKMETAVMKIIKGEYRFRRRNMYTYTVSKGLN
jgi:hypothetical protein